MIEINNEELECKEVTTLVHPETGETVIVDGEPNDDTGIKEFDDFKNELEEAKKDPSNNIFNNTETITEDDMLRTINSPDSLFHELNNDSSLPIEDVRILLEIANKKIKGEKVNAYKEFPPSAKAIIDEYVNSNADSLGANKAQINLVKRNVAETLLDEFIDEIQIDKFKFDYSEEMDKMVNSTSKDIADTALEYMEDRNIAYREAVNKIEDEEKRTKLLAILDEIDNARALTNLKEFSKTCKIKPIELEKPQKRSYDPIMNKYKTSSNNIYDINLARNALYRVLSKDGYTIEQIDAFLIAFCKQVTNYDINNPTQHAYMYYVLYYCALLDGEKNTIYVDNIKEVIENLKKKNNILNK